MKYTGILGISLVLLIPQIGAAQETLTAGIQNDHASEQPMLVADATEEPGYEGLPADDVSTDNNEGNSADPTNPNGDASQGTESNEGNEANQPDQNGDATQNEGGY